MTDVEEFAREIVLCYLNDYIEFDSVYEHDLADGWDEDDLATVHDRANEILRKVHKLLVKGLP